MIENWASKLEARALLAAVFTAYWLRHSQATWSLGNNMSNTWAAWSVARQDFLVTSVSQCGLCLQLLLATPLALGSCQTVLQMHGATRKNIGTATPICHICHICHIYINTNLFACACAWREMVSLNCTETPSVSANHSPDKQASDWKYKRTKMA